MQKPCSFCGKRHFFNGDCPGGTLPGTGEDIAGLLRQKAAAPIKPSKPQKPADIGLFSDERDQTEFKL
ncbi:hypothetical protein ABIB86_000398 [Bradyrhizobium sp. JR1.7]|uniref:hypothetical protein n=1 Tax=unclassified Bradyrhizobium TaxID=2631580 RepID=UPI003391159A